MNKKICLAAMILLFWAGFLWGREVVLAVEDADLAIPLEGAVIHSWDGVEYVCDEEGRALISVPDDRQVTVQVTYPGYETGRLVIVPGKDRFSLGLRLGGVMESRELVIEASRPGMSETKSGRSVAISGEALERSSQIGLIEDVMTSIKLLPGVGYTGMFNAMPSIRGGDPGDLMAVLDGFYIQNPYHWGGGFSIFDPHMVESAQLSHGVFSARFGHTISGLLEVSSKKADTSSAELELGVSTSAVNLNASFPFNGKGGIMAMGKATYWDPFVWAAKQLSKVVNNESLSMINYVTTAPYIRSAEISAAYRINQDLAWNAAVFVGADGVGAFYENELSTTMQESSSRMEFTWDNLQGFFITGLTFNPRPFMVLKATAGLGITQAIIDAVIDYDYLRMYKINPGGGRGALDYQLGGSYLDRGFTGDETSLNAQGRLDFDWNLGGGFLLALGAQELYQRYGAAWDGQYFAEVPAYGPFVSPWPPYSVIIPQGEKYYNHYPVYGARPQTKNQLFNTSLYTLVEYKTPGGRLAAELGLRGDHLYFRGDDFTIQTLPVLNPRLNVDFNVFKRRGVVDSLDLAVGTGLFSSMNDAVNAIGLNSGIEDFTLKPNRSWTSVGGLRMDFSGGWSFNLEGYFKYIFDRAYRYRNSQMGTESQEIYRFDGDGMVWGFDLMLQKFDSRYWDGWLSYTFTHAKYHESERPSPEMSAQDIIAIEDSGWYYPYFHRFHNLNLVLNFKPSQKINIYTRLGLASGRPKPAVGKIIPYQVVLRDRNGNPVDDSLNPGTPLVITKYKRDSAYDDDSRTTWSIPLDVKFSYYMFKPQNKVQTEFYIALENLLSLVYVAKANTTFNSYTGEEDTGSDSANYELPIPMISVGVKWTY